MRSCSPFTPLVLLVLISSLSVFSQQAPIPLIARYDMQTVPGTQQIRDEGPVGIPAKLAGTIVDDAQRGKALRIDGRTSYLEVRHDYLNRMLGRLTISAWVKVDAFPPGNNLDQTFLFWKGNNAGLQICLTKEQTIFFHGNWGGGWYHGPYGGKLPENEWAHVALVFEKGGNSRVLINGKRILSTATEFATWPVDYPLVFGGSDWQGWLAGVRIYAAALSDEQVALDMQNNLPTRAPAEADFIKSGYPVRMALARFDMPIGQANFDTRIKQDAQRKPGPDAVDWPQLTLEVPGREPLPLFEKGAQQNIEVPLAEEPKNRPLFQQPYDNIIAPTGHWFRALPWRWGQYYVYTTDRTARTSSSDYEIWSFPVRITAEADGIFTEVELRVHGKTIYSRKDALHSLTLLLPELLDGESYELKIDGRAPVRFRVGLKPYEPGNPKDEMLPVDLRIPGNGTHITVTTLKESEAFPNQKQWDDDLKALAAGVKLTGRFSVDGNHRSFLDHLGIDVPRSPVSVNLMYQRHGMSHGFLLDGEYKGTPEEYARLLGEIGVDLDVEPAGGGWYDRFDPSNDAWIRALAAQGIRGALNPALNSLSHSNFAFFAYNLPDFHANAYRDAQLLMQRYKDCPNMAGLVIGGDNAGYVPFWDWAPPIPNRPWGRALTQFLQTPTPKVPVGPAIQPGKDYEWKGTEREFLDYIRSYDKTFEEYGYIAKAVAAVNPNLVFTTGSFGSSPGVGGRGGWPWASIPGKPMHKDLRVQTAYDWNEVSSSLPLHNVALIDRLRSYYPEKTTWTTIDDFGLFFGREARQRAYALALTRGVQAVGTTFLAHTTGIDPAKEESAKLLASRKQTITEQKELFAWIHRFGGVYAMTEPDPVIGVLYVHEQAISRHINAQDPAGPHEGKTTETLFLCHMAGWPAKIITPEELLRGLPAGMKAILLVGLNKFDDTWVWHEGLQPALERFVKTGGRVLLDHESVSPVSATQTGMQIAAYVQQSINDPSPLLLARNRENAVKLQQAMDGVPRPFAWSSSETLWAVPSHAGDVQYVTAVNWMPRERPDAKPDTGIIDRYLNASQYVKPQVGTLNWNTKRPIYDLRLGRKLTPAEAQNFDLTQDGFRFYALPPAEVTKPVCTVKMGADQYYYLTCNIGVRPITGIPLEIIVSRGEESTTIYAATGAPTKLPVCERDLGGKYSIKVTELLSGLSNTLSFSISRPTTGLTVDLSTPIKLTCIYDTAVKAFASRKDKPLTIALTPEQAKDEHITALAKRLMEYYRGKGRTVTQRLIAPGEVVTGLQQYAAVQRYPQWSTIESDLILLGTPQNNLLLMDQARGGLLPADALDIKPGNAAVSYAWSPFVGEYNVLNLIAADFDGLQRAVQALDLSNR